MADFRKKFSHGYIHAQFFANFPDKAMLVSFTRLELTAGKFPKSAEV